MVFILSLTTLCFGCKKEEQQNTETVSEEIQTEENSENRFRQEALSQRIMAVNGEYITFEETLNIYRGKPVLIDVWASWCPDCIKGMPKVHDLQNQFKDIV